MRAHTINSEHTKKAFFKWVDELFEKHKYLTFNEPRIGADRSLDQNALLHVWCTEWIAYKLKIDKRQVSKANIESIKRTVKKLYYQATKEQFMIYELTDYSTGLTRKDYTSSKWWKTGEMFMVLNYMQVIAAEDGCVLESRGEHAKLAKEQVT